jgi:NAD(P)-dependent dehydrogenase (short-subunit alcohol dehydrogenase family)
MQEMSFDFSGQVAIVTGGSRGLGRVIVEQLLEAGAFVVTCSRRAPEVSISAQYRGEQREALAIEADIRSEAGVASVIAATMEGHGKIDLLVNNAGGSPAVAASDTSASFFEKVVALNLTAPFLMAKAANEVMQAQANGGVVVNVGSVSGMRPSPNTVAYSAAKAGLINMTETLAVEWAPKVRVVCVSAGLLDTGAGPEHYGGEAGFARVAATVPLGRMGLPSDIAAMVLAMGSGQAAYVSGANLVVHGGGEWPAYLTAARG